MADSQTWRFPLPRTHTGMLLGNGTLGAMVWGGGTVLNITLGRADLWDHRGGKPWTAAMNYADIRRFLEAGDEAGLRGAFESIAPAPGMPNRPSVVPIGRLELHFDAGTTLDTGTVFFDDGYATVQVTDADGRRHTLTIDLAMDASRLHVEIPRALAVQVKPVPAWELIGDYLATVSFTPPVPFETDGWAGWTQPFPADPPVRVAYARTDTGLWITVDREPSDARPPTSDLATMRRDNARWWARYWGDVPEIDIPNDRLAFIYRYGMYKFAGLTNPTGVAATLQGPWIEEYQMPPWSSDYHFNINVQMCYWPAYQGNRLEHLRPMFDLVWGWRDQLRENARLFIGVEDGYLLPHAVDDHGTCMGGFWTGTVDHGCTAWIALMMLDYYRYTGDTEFLRTVAYPFMVGAMRVYEAMLEPTDTPPLLGERGPGGEGRTYALPVSVSPEYRGSALNAWGRNASFQLAACHALLEGLQEAAGTLGEAPEPMWAEIQAGLPKASIAAPPPYNAPKIMLWDGTDLEESHRHHSHLAGIYPFDTLDLRDQEQWALALTSVRWWWRQGMGQWTGWCIPWAAMIASRLALPDLTQILLEYWQRMFTNEGDGTLHDAVILKGLMRAQPAKDGPIAGGFGHGKEVMQIEAGMAAAAAVLDSMAHVRRGVHYLFPGCPDTWREARVAGIRTQGGFLIDAERRNGATVEVKVLATVGGPFRLANPWPGATVQVDGDLTGTLTGDVLALDLAAGMTVRLRA